MKNFESCRGGACDCEMVVRRVKNHPDCKVLFPKTRTDLPDELLAVFVNQMMGNYFDLIEYPYLFINDGEIRGLRKLIIDEQGGMVTLLNKG